MPIRILIVDDDKTDRAIDLHATSANDTVFAQAWRACAKAWWMLHLDRLGMVVLLMSVLGGCGAAAPEDELTVVSARYCEYRSECDDPVTWCDEWQYCHSYETVQECTAGVRDQAMFPSAGLTEYCRDAYIKKLECEISQPCNVPDSACDAPLSIWAYECTGVSVIPFMSGFCGYRPADLDECRAVCEGLSYEYYGFGWMCLEQTPDFCDCGTATCEPGQKCCWCGY